jgi:hypothetical protein
MFAAKHLETIDKILNEPERNALGLIPKLPTGAIISPARKRDRTEILPS